MIHARWRGAGLIACNLIALLLLASWLWPRSRLLWDGFDAAAFQLLNAPLATNAAWAHVWGVCNMRPVDLGFGLIMLAILIKGNFIFAAAQVREALYAFVAVLVLLLLIRVGPLNELVKAMHWQRASPSLTVDGAVRLTVLFPDWVRDWRMKDSSGVSFPGDHASIPCCGRYFFRLLRAAGGAGWSGGSPCCSCCQGSCPAPTGSRMSWSAACSLP
jgi:hypothetical protein